ncbi:MAG: elongation factor Ts [Gammaproteobacteria bacterium]|nr:MAG: elongation factor Ts [Gammaproteobacteria bacterium]
MTQITAAMVKELRERTGAGMMECKKALVETGGDMEAAIEYLRKTGLAKAVKKAGRIAAEGIIAMALEGDKKGAMVEVNCETDFVAKGEDFQAFARKVAEKVLEASPESLEALLALPLDGTTVEEARKELIAKVGENINVRRFARLATEDGHIGSYRHGTRIGVLVEVVGGDAALAKDIAMHIAASHPVCVSPEDVPEEMVAKERAIFLEQAKASGKPENIIEKMVEGRLRKFLSEVTLVGQPFVKDPEITVGELLRRAGAEVRRFVRFEVGEGIEKKAEDFAAEVKAQVGGG